MLNAFLVEPLMAPYYQAYSALLAPVVAWVIEMYQSLGPLRMPTWDDYEYIKAEVIRISKLVANYIVEELPGVLLAYYLTTIEWTVWA